MAEPVLLDQRIISGKGIIRIPTAARKSRYYRLFLDVIREPKNKYANFQWNPPQSLYARFTYLRDEYVQAYDEMKFDREERRQINDVAGQTLIAVKCAYDGTLTSFANIATGLGLTVTSVTDLIQDFQNLQLSWDEIRFSCYADTAIQVRLYGTNYDTCDPEKDDQDDPPPPPPPRDKVPPGTPIDDISRPYDEESNDGGNTDPFPDDSLEEPEGQIECQLYDVTIRCFPLEPELYPQEVYTRRMYGPIIGATPNNEGRNAAIICRGGPDSFDPPPSPCLEVDTECVVISNTNPAYVSVVIEEIVAV